MRLLYAVAVLLFATTVGAQDTCTSVADLDASGPVIAIPSDAPVFSPLRWGMTRAQARQTLRSDGWTRSDAGTDDGSDDGLASDHYTGEMFGQETAVVPFFDTSGRLVSITALIEQTGERVWERRLWDEVRATLIAGYGEPDTDTETVAPSRACTTFAPGGTSTVESRWPTVLAGIGTRCTVLVGYNGPGYNEALHAAALAQAQEADRVCLAEAARLRRDRSRLAPADSVASLPQRVAPRVPPRPPPAPTLSTQPGGALDEEPPQLIGGLENLWVTYPEFERRAGIQGRVIVSFDVDLDGRASNISIVRGVSPGLDRAAVDAVTDARFFPGKRSGEPVVVRFTLPVTFRLDAPTPPSTYPN